MTPPPRQTTAVRVASETRYAEHPPYDPAIGYPELAGISPIGKEENSVYDLVRETLLDAGFDRPHRGTADWSPFKDYLSPGQTVVIKPNWVQDSYIMERQNAITTHASVIRPVVDYCWKALQGQGRILVADAPTAETDFEKVVERTGALPMVQILKERGYHIGLRDLRRTVVESEHGIWVREAVREESAEEGIEVNLGDKGFFADPAFKGKLHGGGYGRYFTQRAHSGSRQAYLVSRTILEADLFISMPKLKTHRKAGISCCLKNLVGINIDKNYLPHFSVGPVNAGGDEFPALDGIHTLCTRTLRLAHDLILDRAWRILGIPLAKCLGAVYGIAHNGQGREGGKVGSYGGPGKQRRGRLGVGDWVYRIASGQDKYQGAWQGNETIWRMILDLNRIILYADKDGIFQSQRARPIIEIVDGIVVGAGNGPLNAQPVLCGAIAAGTCSLAIDLALLKLAGIEPTAIPLYREALKAQDWMVCDHSLEDVLCNGASVEGQTPMAEKLTEPDGWRFHE